jgi:hypothetical protein
MGEWLMGARPSHEWDINRVECRRCLLTKLDVSIYGWKECMTDREIAASNSRAARLVESLYRVPR